MTNATSVPVIADLEKAFADAKSGLAEAEKVASVKVAEITGKQPIDFVALNAASEPVDAARRVVDRASAALAEVKSKDAWAKSEPLKAPLLRGAHEVLIDSAPSARIIGWTGSIKIAKDGDDAGQADVTLTARLESIDVADLETLIAATVDGKGFLGMGIDSLDLNIDMSKTPVTISLMPTAAVTIAARAKGASNGTRTGKHEFNFAGSWLGTKAFLMAVEASQDAEVVKVVATHKASFDTALRGTGNGLSNLATKTVAPKLNVETRSS